MFTGFPLLLHGAHHYEAFTPVQLHLGAPCSLLHPRCTSLFLLFALLSLGFAPAICLVWEMLTFSLPTWHLPFLQSSALGSLSWRPPGHNSLLHTLTAPAFITGLTVTVMHLFAWLFNGYQQTGMGLKEDQSNEKSKDNLSWACYRKKCQPVVTCVLWRNFKAGWRMGKL